MVEDPSSVSEEMKKKIQTVLLVDDIPLNLKLLQVLCRKFGISEILLAGNGKEALNILKTNSTVDLVLTDLWMPEMNGEELVNKIREQKCFIKLPIYAVTADITAPKRFSLEKFSGIIYKPVTFDKIIKILSEISS